MKKLILFLKSFHSPFSSFFFQIIIKKSIEYLWSGKIKGEKEFNNCSKNNLIDSRISFFLKKLNVLNKFINLKTLMIILVVLFYFILIKSNNHGMFLKTKLKFFLLLIVTYKWDQNLRTLLFWNQQF